MILPHTLAARYIETPVKALVARRMSREGLSQSEIAGLIGVSQPTVNMYLRDPSYSEENILKRLGETGLSIEEVAGLVDELYFLLKRGERTEALKRLTVFVNRQLSSLKLCSLHREIDPTVPEDCRICSELFLVDEQIEMYSELDKAFEMISRIRGLGRLVPEVGMNIVYARRGARGLGDVLAFPGRIVRVDDYVATVSRPAWGSSGHLGRIILRVVSERPEIRSVVNLRSHECIRVWASQRGLVYRETGPHETGSIAEVEDAVARAAVEDRGVRIVIDLGGRWIEPNVYVFGENPLRIALLLSDIVEFCTERGLL